MVWRPPPASYDPLPSYPCRARGQGTAASGAGAGVPHVAASPTDNRPEREPTTAPKPGEISLDSSGKTTPGTSPSSSPESPTAPAPPAAGPARVTGSPPSRLAAVARAVSGAVNLYRTLRRRTPPLPDSYTQHRPF